jgi:hypothetical protein
MIAYHRTGGRVAEGQPPDDEHLEVDGSDFALERRSGAPAVGRFGGPLDDPVVDELDDLAAAVTGDGDGPSRPDAAAVEVRAGDRVGRFGQGSAPDDAWAALERRLEQLTGELVASPVAAIALEIAEDGRSARLVHRGTEPVEVDLSDVQVHAFLWKGYYEPAGEWRGAEAGGPETAGRGWAHELPFDHGLPVGPDTTLQVEVRFGLGGRPAEVVHAPPIAPAAS